MEVTREDGTLTRVNVGQTRELGRGHGLTCSDKTISRRQVLFSIPRPPDDREETLIQFEVLGRNPIYVSQGDEVKIFRRFERGEIRNGDMFCVSAKNPVWYTIRKIKNGDEGGVRRNDLDSKFDVDLKNRFESTSFEDLEQARFDLSGLDLVKEFAFIKEGHEFDSYPKKMFCDIKDLDWFLEETRKDTDDDEDDSKMRKQSSIRKRKKDRQNEYEEWSAESEDDKIIIDKSIKGKKPQYMTRSKNRGKTSKKVYESQNKSSAVKKTLAFDDEENDDEDDETVGGFIVDDENLEDEEEILDSGQNDIEEEELVDSDEEDEHEDECEDK